MNFDGILFFPVTPFDTDGRIDDDLLRTHVATALEHSPGGVFPACGTGEFHALSADEAAHVVKIAAETVGGRVPVVAGTGGPLGHATALAKSAADAGADALLVLPPYLVGGPQAGLVAYVEAVAAASDLPVVIYHRGNAQYSVDSVRRLAQNPKVVGFKDGVGDVGVAQQIVRAVADAGRDDFAFFNGLLTAELTQGAYRGIGIPLYSSAAFAMIPEVANAYYRAYVDGDEVRRGALLDGFYSPLVKLRDETPGFGVSLIKAGLRLGGLPVGSVRAPLVDPTPAQEARLGEILEAGRALL
ncbi:5-dehydro-4-deoxyglucarate dehydratase [Microbacterium terrae]|uniref:Probable 5-dehydro-4-deoxyglucarate dehydratase n=1 Tax=Microbacterium terrae TaxID=69369 RepID=A0A0M2HFK3_9MICO|nr:5-dehydro-4-deoxyglucarate dehydratase [Microbacterium terrae]KJL43043.1 putative 5-dehydro-4-deoxyglucarate dehydratase [Microbacterium terrae]MBP1079368.1 5-dehydro-4-deoxyglucarate dehydratase [Microbacterium terrae]GLJ98768.1 putative 5-dehydro-4-deoxyglucarate dehydratase [Microbacterium terrae]